MKLLVMFTVAFVAQIHASVYPQNNIITLDLNNKSIREVLSIIEDSSKFKFFFNEDFINVDTPVSLKASGSGIEEILARMFERTDINYRILENNMIVLTKGDHFQQQKVSGKITDAQTGEPIAGVTIQVKGTNTGAISQADGTYSVNIADGVTTLIFSFIGYQAQEVDIAGRAIIDIMLSEEVTALQEIVVTGYAVEKKKDIIGSVTVVDMKNTLSQPSGNITTALQGKAAGLTISSDGTPGGTGRVRIRGYGSFSSSEPLYIIDGVPGSADRLNPQDIKSIQVLKDAASASVYGSRASNGVVIITTIGGNKNSKLTVDLDSYYGVNYVNEDPHMLNAKEYGEVYWKKLEGAGRTVGDASWGHPQYGHGISPVLPEYILANVNGDNRYGGAELETLKLSNPILFNSLVNPANYDFETHQIVKAGNTDWWDEVFNPASIQNHQITISGGSDKVTYAISANYFDETSSASKYSFYKRYSVRANSAYKIGEKIRVGENIQVSYKNWREVSNVKAAWLFHPLIPVYDIEGNPASSAAPGLVAYGGTIGRNPVTEPWRNRFDKNSSYGIFGNVYLELDILKNLTAKTLFGLDYYNQDSEDFAPTTYEHLENNNPAGDMLTWNWNYASNWVWTNTLSYAKEVQDHKFSLILGTEASLDYSQNLAGLRYGFDIQDDDNFLVLNSGTGTQTNSSSFSRSTLFSLFGRFDYSFANKYILNTTLRRDGSSKFGKNNRYGYFPAVAIGWRVSSENFMRNLTWLSDLKLRASYGIIGNQSGLPNSNQYTTYTASDQFSYAISGLNNSYSSAFSANTLGNEDAKWEKTVSSNFGLDMTILSGKLSFSAEYYVKKTTDLLVQNQAPLTGTMATQPYVNVGNIDNKGIELNLIHKGTVIRDLNYEFGVIFNKYKNKVVKILDNPSAFLSGYYDPSLPNISRTMAGYPIAMFYGYKIDGFFNSQEEVDTYNNEISTTWLTPAVGRWRIKDVNKDGAVNDLDRVMLGSPHPDFQMSFDLSLRYKNFDLYSFLFWSQGGEIFNLLRNSTDFNLAYFNMSERVMNESWTPENHDAKLPKLDASDLVSNKYATDYFVEDATYLRLKTLQLGYSISQTLLSKVRVQKLRVYIQFQNLFTITKFSGLDPDAGYSGSATSSSMQAENLVGSVDGKTNDLLMGVFETASPTPKQFILGVNVSF